MAKRKRTSRRKTTTCRRRPGQHVISKMPNFKWEGDRLVVSTKPRQPKGTLILKGPVRLTTGVGGRAKRVYG